mgnify:CR=1 FL=1
MRKIVRLTPRQKTNAPPTDCDAHRANALQSNFAALAFLAAVCASVIARNAASRTPRSDCSKAAWAFRLALSSRSCSNFSESTALSNSVVHDTRR